MENETKKVKVIFRKWTYGCEVIALFPEIPADSMGYNCQSYMHVGQHGSASPDIVSDTTPANPDEYKKLHKELTDIGYDLEVVKRFRYEYQVTRAKQYK